MALKLKMNYVTAGAYAIIAIISIGFILHAVSVMNLEYSHSWKFDADTSEMIDDLSNFHRKTVQTIDKPIDLGCHWLLSYTVNYYRITKNLKHFNAVARHNLKSDHDYYFLRPEDKGLLKKKNLSIIKKYPITGNILARKKKYLI